MGRIARNLVLLLSGKTVAGLISLIYIALSARLLGLAEYGVLNLVHGYATFMGALIAFSGFHPVVTFGTKALHEGSPARLGRLLGLMTLLEVGLAIVAIGVTASLSQRIGRALDWSPAVLAIAPVYSLAILATVRATPWGLLQIVGRFDLIAIHQALMPIVRLAGTLLIFAKGGGLEAFLIVWLAASVLEGLSMWLLAWHCCKQNGIELLIPTPTRLRQAIAENDGIVPFLTITNLDQTLREFAPKSIPLIVGWLSGASVAGLYAMSVRIGSVLTQPPQLLGQAAYSVVQKLVASGELDRARTAVNRAALSMTLVSMAVATVMSIGSEHIITFFAGPEFMAGSFLLALILAARAIAAATPLWSTTLTSLGRAGTSLRINVICNLLSLPLLPVLLSVAETNGAGYHAIFQAFTFAALLWFADRQAMAKSIKENRVAGAC